MSEWLYAQLYFCYNQPLFIAHRRRCIQRCSDYMLIPMEYHTYITYNLTLILICLHRVCITESTATLSFFLPSYTFVWLFCFVVIVVVFEIFCHCNSMTYHIKSVLQIILNLGILLKYSVFGTV